MTAEWYLKKNGLKNPPLDSGISGGGDAPRIRVSDAMEMYATEVLKNLHDYYYDKMMEMERRHHKEIKAVKRDLRRAVADYMASEGCNCCEGDDHSKHADAIAKLLGVKKYKDGSGYDFSKYESK